jgi:hypothetical protein
MFPFQQLTRQVASQLATSTPAQLQLTTSSGAGATIRTANSGRHRFLINRHLSRFKLPHFLHLASRIA